MNPESCLLAPAHRESWGGNLILAPLSAVPPSSQNELLKHTLRQESSENRPVPSDMLWLPGGAGSSPTSLSAEELSLASWQLLECARLSPVPEASHTVILWGPRPTPSQPPLPFSFGSQQAVLTQSPGVCDQRGLLHCPHTLTSLFTSYCLSPSLGMETWSILGVTLSPEFGTEPEVVGVPCT